MVKSRQREVRSLYCILLLSTDFKGSFCGESPWPRGSVLNLRSPGIKFGILCPEGGVMINLTICTTSMTNIRAVKDLSPVQKFWATTEPKKPSMSAKQNTKISDTVKINSRYSDIFTCLCHVAYVQGNHQEWFLFRFHIVISKDIHCPCHLIADETF